MLHNWWKCLPTYLQFTTMYYHDLVRSDTREKKMACADSTLDTRLKTQSPQNICKAFAYQTPDICFKCRTTNSSQLIHCGIYCCLDKKNTCRHKIPVDKKNCLCFFIYVANMWLHMHVLIILVTRALLWKHNRAAQARRVYKPRCFG